MKIKDLTKDYLIPSFVVSKNDDRFQNIIVMRKESYTLRTKLYLLYTSMLVMKEIKLIDYTVSIAYHQYSNPLIQNQYNFKFDVFKECRLYN